MPAAKQKIGSTHGGQAVDCYTLTNRTGVAAKIMTYQCCLSNIMLFSTHGRSPISTVAQR
jgi:hypothetical protein